MLLKKEGWARPTTLIRHQRQFINWFSLRGCRNGAAYETHFAHFRTASARQQEREDWCASLKLTFLVRSCRRTYMQRNVTPRHSRCCESSSLHRHRSIVTTRLCNRAALYDGLWWSPCSICALCQGAELLEARGLGGRHIERIVRYATVLDNVAHSSAAARNVRGKYLIGTGRRSGPSIIGSTRNLIQSRNTLSRVQARSIIESDAPESCTRRMRAARRNYELGESGKAGDAVSKLGEYAVC